MPDISRRGLLALGAITAPLANASQKKAGFSKPIGVQLYTVRDVLPREPDGTLKAIADLGYKEVETSRADVDKYSALFDKYGLKCYSVHLETPLITGQGKAPEGVTLDGALEDLKKRGIEFVG